MSGLRHRKAEDGSNNHMQDPDDVDPQNRNSDRNAEDNPRDYQEAFIYSTNDHQIDTINELDNMRERLHDEMAQIRNHLDSIHEKLNKVQDELKKQQQQLTSLSNKANSSSGIVGFFKSLPFVGN